ncbi:MAG: ABC transporter permease [Planctomycetota bacterium]|jgi:ribose transport system permease protein
MVLKSRVQGQAGILAVLFALIAYFAVTADGFLGPENVLNIVRQISMLGISAVGMTFVILTAGIDLSVGSLMSLINVVCAKLMVEAGFHPVWAVLVSLILACLVGLINGVIITRAKVPPLITTLGMMITLRGLSYVICDGDPIWGFTDRFRVLGQGYVGIVPIPVIIMFAMFAVGWIFLNKTIYGRYIYGVGGNEEASRLSGVDVPRIKCLAYILSGLLTGVAAIIMLSRLNTGQPKIGTGFELDVITAVVLGGVSIFGGRGRLTGVFVGVLIMGVLSNGLISLDISEYYQQIIRGMVLLGAVAFDNLSKSRKN